jgi:hypothetical protein
MTYFFSDPAGLNGFYDLAKALTGAGRKLPLLPPVQRGVYRVKGKAAAPRVKVGADVLPWWPIRGVYFLLERGFAPAGDLAVVDGVAGVWSSTATEGDQSITYCFLDADPVATADQLRPLLEKRWQNAEVEPLLAAPMYPVVAHEWDRYLP